MLRLALLVALIGSTGCYVETEYPTATLAYVEPGVEVVTDLDYPVFFVDGLYWRWYGGYWYSSSYWGGGWGYARFPPPRVRGIGHGHPESYAHFHPRWSDSTRSAPRVGGGHVGGGHAGGAHVGGGQVGGGHGGGHR
jgi:hypothetical protein